MEIARPPRWVESNKQPHLMALQGGHAPAESRGMMLEATLPHRVGRRKVGAAARAFSG